MSVHRLTIHLIIHCCVFKISSLYVPMNPITVVRPRGRGLGGVDEGVEEGVSSYPVLPSTLSSIPSVWKIEDGVKDGPRNWSTTPSVVLLPTFLGLPEDSQLYEKNRGLSDRSLWIRYRKTLVVCKITTNRKIKKLLRDTSSTFLLLESL